MLRRFFLWPFRFLRSDPVLCTAFVFALMFGLKDVAGRFDFLNPFELALSDFEMMDVIYSAGIREEQEPDTNIVLVNIGKLPRRLIARQLEVIASMHPRSVGIDASFLADKDPLEDSLLEAAMARTPNLVLFSEFSWKKAVKGFEPFDTIIFCHPRFARHGKPGFVNLLTPLDTFHICRSFFPVDSLHGKKYLSFAMQAAWFEDSSKVKDFLARHNSEEIISFRGNSDRFFRLDWHDVLGMDDESGFYQNPDLGINLKDKIVFMGYMGDSFEEEASSIVDKFFTPLNPNVAGKTYPDMFGVVIHANIASMVLRGKPTNAMPEAGNSWLAVLLCYFNVVLFFFIHRNHPTWYDLSVKTIQIVEVGLILYLAIYIYGVYNYKIDVSLTAFAVGFSGDVLEIYVGLKGKVLRLIERVFRKGRA